MDDRMRQLGHAARSEVEATVDIDEALSRVTQQGAVADQGVSPQANSSSRARIWLAVAAAASVAAAGWIALPRANDSIKTASPIVTPTPANAPPATTTPTITEQPATTIQPATTAQPSGQSPSTTESGTVATPPDGLPLTISVDVNAPPPELDLQPFNQIAIDSDAQVTIGELGVVVNRSDEGFVTVLSFEGQRRDVEIKIDSDLDTQGLSNIIYGPGDVIYGLRPTGPPYGLVMDAIPLGGELAGQSVAQSEALDSATWVELPPAPFGHGEGGVVARARDVGATLMNYVDESGGDADLRIVPPFATVSDDLVVSSSSGPTWQLQINGVTTAVAAQTGPAVPAASSGQRTVYPTDLLNDSAPASPSRPVIAVLESDGTGAWWSIPEGWRYAASDSVGTLFTRFSGSLMEFALLPGGPQNWRSLGYEASRIPATCGEVGCTQVSTSVRGQSVSYDPNTRTLTRHSAPPVTATLPESYGSAYIEYFGPDDVVYLQVDQTVDDEFSADIVAVSMEEEGAGSEVARWPGGGDGLGHFDFVPTPAGLVEVSNLDLSATPISAEGIAIPWTSATGEAITDLGLGVIAELQAYPSATITRTQTVTGVEQSWTVEVDEGSWFLRHRPQITPTFDGGFITEFVGPHGQTAVRGWPDGTVEVVELDTHVDAFEPSGTALIRNGSYLARVPIFVDRGEYWDGGRDTYEDGMVEFPGLDTSLEGDRPGWRTDPVAFGHAIAGRLAVNETRHISASQTSEFRWLVTVTTGNFFDDSIYGSRLEIELGRNDLDGSFRVVSAQRSQICQPGRGHQDFSTEFCT